MRVRRLTVLAGALVALGCSQEAEPRSQWVIDIGTDAPLPQFGEQLLVEVLDENGELACAGCERLIGLSSTQVWPVSLGVVPPSTQRDLRVRARLYRTAITGLDGRPSGTALLDALGRLPAPSGVSHVALALEMACFGVPADPGAHTSCDPALGSSSPEPTLTSGMASLPRPGDFDRTADCTSEAPPGMACMPGGVFLLGDARVSFFGQLSAHPERLVQLSPFFVDLDEFTVGQMRQLVKEGKVQQSPMQPAASGQPFDACTYLGPNDASNDALPVACLPRGLAQAACEALGKRLPTEAEWEYTAGNGVREDDYPWGDEPATCERVIAGRGPSAGEGFVELGAATVCRIDASGKVVPKGPVAGGSPLDTNANGVRNLGGSMTEWVADAFVPYDSPCWRDGPTLLVDPLCEGPDSAPVSTRGGSWVYSLFFARAAARQAANKATAAGDALGFRCVRPAGG